MTDKKGGIGVDFILLAFQGLCVHSVTKKGRDDQGMGEEDEREFKTVIFNLSI